MSIIKMHEAGNKGGAKGGVAGGFGLFLFSACSFSAWENKVV